MTQAVALLVTAGLVVGGVLGTGVIEDGASGPREAPETAGGERDASAGGVAAGGAGQAEADGAGAGGARPPGAGGRGADAGGTVTAFCSATQRLRRARENYLLGVRAGDEGATTRAEAQAAERSFVRRNKPLFDAVRRTAPPSIRSDLAAVTGSTGGASGQQRAAAFRRVSAFVQRNC